jgi:simple sugar transport system permease protein
VLYAYAGVVAGIAGMVYVSNNRTANPFDLHGDELVVIAAVVLGGTSIEGGKGSILGVLLGCLLTVIINNSLVLIGVPSYWQKATFGAIILVAITAQVLKDRAKAKPC